MPTSRETLFCAQACRETPLMRSFGPCRHCGECWNMQSGDQSRHYRNNAWRLCETCARDQHRCLVCGGALPRATRV